ncbi:MAG: hypothetical protein HY899_07080, partial [Deltaproteobacteria bacterium]|nr:hypothetical protein [Deltaproteobacteria bacterium]
TTVSTGALCGEVLFGDTFAYTLAAGHVVTATATDPSGNTSEFSACAGRCGDGIVGSGEQCDDGNVADGDCCSASCQYEVGSCNDGNLCTQTDTCQGGVCTGSDPVVCTVLDQCHDAGTCDPGTGCSNPPTPPGTACGSSSSGQCDDADSCDGAGVCLANHVTDGTTCDDGSVCTEQDGCVAGTCTGTPLPQGTACTDDGIPCTEDLCDAAGMCQHNSPTGAYTLDADFDQGTLFNVNHNVADQLQLSWPTAPFPFVNVAASDRGTIVRIDVNGGQILGEYRTAPDSMGRNPSRTTVDQDGNVWVANRDEYGFSGGQEKGSATRVGLLVGGTRTDAAGTPDASGQYVKPPFQYNTCVDRDGDGLLETSSGLGNILLWTNAGSVDSDGGVSTAEDECIINYTRVTGTGTRTIAVDANNDAWVGGYGNAQHEKISGITGLPIPGTQFFLGCGGYGGLIDHNGVLWSAREYSGLLRFDTTTLTGACLGTAMGDYGLGIDPQTGEIWHSSYYQGKVCNITPAGTLIQCYAAPTSRGVAVDGSGNVWVVNSDIPTVRHLRTDGTLVGDVALPGAIFSTGVAVDTNGKVWVTNKNENVMRIDPSAGLLGGGGFPIGAVDMTVNLGPNAGPYNYSDMTGFVAIGSTSQQGTWIVTRDSGVTGNLWGAVSWNTEQQGSEPSGTSIGVEVRAADTVTGLASQLFTAVTNGGASGVSGRFIEIRATLRSTAISLTPVLSDLEVQVGCGPTTCSTEADCDDADACTLDACSPAESGANSFGCVYTGVGCTALDACHDAGTCNPVTGQCSNPAKPEGSSCQDQDLCTVDEVCQGGTCTAGSALDCDDGNICSVDACDSVSGCTHVPGNAGVVCRPAVDECDVAETCTGLSTVCPNDNSNPACCGPKIFIVTSTADSSDASIGDAACADASENCTLRAAIEEANVDSCADTINFNIPDCGGVCTLAPATPLPAVTQPVTIDGYTQPGASANTLANGSDAALLIEIDGTGVAAGNGGLSITGGSSTVRGMVINRFASLAGNPPVNGYGINLSGGGGNAITGNFLGTDPTGALARPNERGIGVLSGNNIVGGPTPDARNVVSGNLTGIQINSVTAVSNVVQNNYVGVGPDGNTALGNTGFAGVNIGGGATNNTVGGTTAAAANVIAANSPTNVRIRGSATQNNVIEGNYIGTNAAGTSLGGGGVVVENSASNNRIGGQAIGAGNTIAYNTTAGVTLVNGTGNAILSNSIFANTFGIDIGNNGVGPADDACDPDSGPNLTQNFPVVTSVSGSGGNTTIAGTIDSAAGTTFTLEFFDNTSCDASGYGQGATLIGSTTVSTGALCGEVLFGDTFAYTLAAGHVVTATATDPSGNTSEFSACAGAGGMCGDGSVGPGEQCDDGDTTSGDCCSATCQYEPSTTECRAAAGVCDLAENCTGSSATCPADAKSTSGCRASVGDCDVAESCDGVNNDCPADAFLPDTTQCRATQGACDVAENCTGNGAGCPADAKSTAECRASAGECDAADNCDGVGNDCPADAFAPPTTSCTADSNLCTDDLCDGAGACGHPANSVPCDDGDKCTLDDRCTGTICVGQAVIVKPACEYVIMGGAGQDPTRPKRVGGRIRENATVVGDVCGDTVRVGNNSFVTGDIVATRSTCSGLGGVELGPNEAGVQDVDNVIVTGGAPVVGKPRLTPIEGYGPGSGVTSIDCNQQVTPPLPPPAYYDTTGSDLRIAKCGVSRDGLADYVNNLNAPGLCTASIKPALGSIPAAGVLQIGPGHPENLDSGAIVAGQLNYVCLNGSLKAATDSRIEFDDDGDTATLYVLIITGQVRLPLRSQIALTAPLDASRLLIYGKSKCKIGDDVSGAGTLVCPNSKLLVGARVTWQGALLSGRGYVQVGDNSIVTHVPLLFTE